MDQAKTIGADQAVATDDDIAIASLATLDAVADTVGGRTAEKLIAKVKPGGVYAIGCRGAAKRGEIPVCKSGARILEIRQENAAEAQAAAEKGGVGKILLVA